jgi:adenylate kinase family enzyme
VDKIIITGANGVGKSHFAAKLALIRPKIEIVSFDAIKLKTHWRQRPRTEIDASLATEVRKPEWILEGGPSLLLRAIEEADALVWLDPPELVRAWQLAKRPWKFIGKNRPEIPAGNIDWPLQQYKFALRSLKNRTQFQSYISEVFEAASGIQKWRCRTRRDRVEIINEWAKISR